MATVIRKPYDKHKRYPTKLEGPSKTQQHFKRECDINHLMAKYQKTGVIDHLNQYQGDYSDLTDVPDYQTALLKVQSAQTAFDSLPSSIRSKFQNDPAQFLDFVSNPDNIDEMIELGLASKQPAPALEPEPPAPILEPEPPEA